MATPQNFTGFDVLKELQRQIHQRDVKPGGKNAAPLPNRRPDSAGAPAQTERYKRSVAPPSALRGTRPTGLDPSQGQHGQTRGAKELKAFGSTPEGAGKIKKMRSHMMSEYQKIWDNQMGKKGTQYKAYTDNLGGSGDASYDAFKGSDAWREARQQTQEKMVNWARETGHFTPDKVIARKELPTGIRAGIQKRFGVSPTIASEMQRDVLKEIHQWGKDTKNIQGGYSSVTPDYEMDQTTGRMSENTGWRHNIHFSTEETEIGRQVTGGSDMPLKASEYSALDLSDETVADAKALQRSKGNVVTTTTIEGSPDAEGMVEVDDPMGEDERHAAGQTTKQQVQGVALEEESVSVSTDQARGGDRSGRTYVNPKIEKPVYHKPADKVSGVDVKGASAHRQRQVDKLYKQFTDKNYSPKEMLRISESNKGLKGKIAKAEYQVYQDFLNPDPDNPGRAYIPPGENAWSASRKLKVGEEIIGYHWDQKFERHFQQGTDYSPHGQPGSSIARNVEGGMQGQNRPDPLYAGAVKKYEDIFNQDLAESGPSISGDDGDLTVTDERELRQNRKREMDRQETAIETKIAKSEAGTAYKPLSEAEIKSLRQKILTRHISEISKSFKGRYTEDTITGGTRDLGQTSRAATEIVTVNKDGESTSVGKRNYNQEGQNIVRLGGDAQSGERGVKAMVEPHKGTGIAKQTKPIVDPEYQTMLHADAYLQEHAPEEFKNVQAYRAGLQYRDGKYVGLYSASAALGEGSQSAMDQKQVDRDLRKGSKRVEKAGDFTNTLLAPPNSGPGALLAQAGYNANAASGDIKPQGGTILTGRNPQDHIVPAGAYIDRGKGVYELQKTDTEIFGFKSNAIIAPGGDPKNFIDKASTKEKPTKQAPKTKAQVFSENPTLSVDPLGEYTFRHGLSSKKDLPITSLEDTQALAAKNKLKVSPANEALNKPFANNPRNYKGERDAQAAGPYNKELNEYWSNRQEPTKNLPSTTDVPRSEARKADPQFGKKGLHGKWVGTGAKALGVASLFLTPFLAARSLLAKGADITPGNVALEFGAEALGNSRVLSGVGEAGGYLNQLASNPYKRPTAGSSDTKAGRAAFVKEREERGGTTPYDDVLNLFRPKKEYRMRRLLPKSF
jgi:hypothetical protein